MVGPPDTLCQPGIGQPYDVLEIRRWVEDIHIPTFHAHVKKAALGVLLLDVRLRVNPVMSGGPCSPPRLRMLTPLRAVLRLLFGRQFSNLPGIGEHVDG